MPSCEWLKLHQDVAVLDAAQDALKASALHQDDSC
jgi:hypothetical protein